MPLLVESMASIVTFRVSPYFGLDSECKSRCRVKVRCLSSGDSVLVSGASFVGEKERIGSNSIGGENGQMGSKVEEKKRVKDVVSEQLEALYDDGFGTQTVKDYMDIAKEMIKPDGGPPRWFCPVECGRPLKDSPILLFLPGMEGVGLGLILHHKPLGKAFEVRCLHIPVYDRTPFEGLVKFVEETVKFEHASSPNKPIYLVGDSFGGCLALAIAARNPTIDLLVILVNPATSFGKSQLQPSFPILEAFPEELHFTIPYLLSFVMGDPMKMAMVNVDSSRSPALVLEQFSGNLVALLPRLSGLAKIIPKDTLLWKLKLLKSAAAYANSRLHAVKAEVLVLASGKDYMLPSGDEAQRLSSSLQNCRVRYFKDNGHSLLLEDGINLMTVIKGTSLYRRRSRRCDFISDFLPPSMSEFQSSFSQDPGFRFATSPVIFSTLKDGKMVKGLAGVPTEGPVLLVGYHNLLGFELRSVVEAFLREKNVLVRGLAHPVIFSEEFEMSDNADVLKVFGALPVTPSNLFKLFAAKSHILLYPGGAREALHCKGEEYKLFWPDRPEFVRMAARFGATIVPFGAVGADDIAELVLDYNDMMRLPMFNDRIKEKNRNIIKVRDNMEIDNQQLFIPGIFPKIPGRFYYLFGKPIETKGREDILRDKENANKLYLQIKSEIERILAYLIRKREKDPYRGIIDRTIYRALYAPPDEVPTFEP